MQATRKIFGGKKIEIRKIAQKDIKNAEKFLSFINSLVEEKAKILINEKQTLAGEKAWVKSCLEKNKNHKSILLVAWDGNKVAGSTTLNSERGVKSHVAEFGITIHQNYRGIGLGKFLMSEIIKLARKELKPTPKIARLSVYSNNEPAIALYQKMGFRTVARIPKQYQYKGELLDELVMLLDL